MGKRTADLTGKKFGRLTVLELVFTNPKSHWLCKCECGTTKIMRIDSLQNSVSCGCYARERSTIHGLSQSRFERVYQHARGRCTNPLNRAYQDYGGRGIRFLWKSMKQFKEEMYESYLEHIASHGAERTTIERTNNNGPYCKENCKWATPTEQSNNRRSNRLVQYKGEVKNLKQWSKHFGVNYHTLFTRLSRGWTFEEAGCGRRERHDKGNRS